MVVAETAIAGFVIAVMVVIMGVMIYFAFATQDEERSDDPPAESAE